MIRAALNKSFGLLRMKYIHIIMTQVDETKLTFYRYIHKKVFIMFIKICDLVYLLLSASAETYLLFQMNSVQTEFQGDTSSWKSVTCVLLLLYGVGV